MRKNYQRKARKSNHKFEVVEGQELLVRVPLPMAEVWAEMQAHVEELAGQARLQILRAILENEVTQRVGPPHRPNPSAACVRWGKQPGYVVLAGQKVPLERPRVRTREGQLLSGTGSILDPSSPIVPLCAKGCQGRALAPPCRTAG